MTLRQQVMSRIVLPAGLKALQLARDPMAMLLHESSRDDPYPLYARIRDRGVVQAPVLGTQMIADHAGVTEVLRDQTRFSHDLDRLKGYSPREYPEGDPMREAPRDRELLLMMDPPDHTRVRRLVGKAFSPRAIQSLDEWIRELAYELVEKAVAEGEFDLVADVAMPLPLTVICRMLGVPVEDRDQFEHWGHVAAAGLDLQLDTSAMERTARAQMELGRYLQGLIDDHRAEPRDDILSALIAARDEGDRLSERELVATCLLLLVAGFETTVNLIGNGTQALLRHRHQLERLWSDPALIPNAVEEMLRYDSPVQLTSRIVNDDTELADGRRLRGGHEVISLLAGANRDPSVFEEPDEFDVSRHNAAAHVSFSTGVHHCLGAALARMEAAAAFTALVDRGVPEATAPPTRRPTMVLRGFSSLPVRVAPR